MSAAYHAGFNSLLAAAARLGTVNLSPSISQRDDWGHSWGDFMRGWNAAKKARVNMAKKKTTAKRRNPVKAISLRNFTGKVRLNPDKTVSVVGLGRKKKAAPKRNPWTSTRRKLQDRAGQVRNAVRDAGRTVKAKAYKAVGKRMRGNAAKRRKR